MSSRLAAFPSWVLDYVLVHELAHLLVEHHGPRHDELVNRFPLAERARGFLIAKDLDPDDLDECDEPPAARGRRPPVTRSQFGLSIGAMPYPKRLLNEGEDVALDLRPHWWYFAKHIVGGIVLFVLLVLIFQYRRHRRTTGRSAPSGASSRWSGRAGSRSRTSTGPSRTSSSRRTA